MSPSGRIGDDRLLRVDYLGDPLPPGYLPWSCATCTAVCNFEAMQLCSRGDDCGFVRDEPESNGGAFGFIILSRPTKEPSNGK